MQPIQINAKTLPEAWFFCLKELLVRNKPDYNSGVHEYIITHGSFETQRRLEFDYITIHVEYPGCRPLVPETPLGIPPVSTMEYVEQYLPYLMTSARKPGEEYTYGMYLEPQIQKTIKMYKTGGFGTNQAYMTVGDIDSINQKSPPCLRGIDTRIWKNKLHFMVYFRSWDLWAGFPSNLAAIQILKEYMASEIGVQDGELITSSKGLHLYDTCWDLAKAVVRR